MSATKEEKDALRKAAFVARKAAFAAAGPGQADRLSEVLADHRGVPLSGYMRIRTEIDPTPAMAEAAAHGPVGVPVIEGPGRPLKFRLWTPDAETEEGTFGAHVPAAGDWVVPQVLIVPLLAFDRRGYRMGYGGGFYDRTLAGLRAGGPVLAIGFAFAAQEVAAVPIDATDERLDLIVTEAGVIEPR
ncbi:5-formyltetrahydrofolate cyclo-ligase [Wenxinia marina]|uniref:5-formyltetrahydrofolate cyclo-ligase n=1 Tax=Wenxinia marina DSM 24838 TaxID=1123501 RepID=A0A0D0Q181_9RHOB|nr:5-formyltetrahydrofolate cyclo-ligase [Wenxinia marina]KIQ68329.1 5-formyltetrahydrofolate cyclo-ligase [Wenxinia marina DSM 24838]GGL73027.1 5-formyltetrahydrofolate cyclo-ligase [Wenxinia marina]